jgi:P27 family predicted phage terminase small subunit
MKSGPKSKYRPAPKARAAACLVPPSYLSALAKEEWHRIASDLDTCSLDCALLAAYCEAVSRWRIAQEDIAKNGIFTTTANGYRVQSP